MVENSYTDIYLGSSSDMSGSDEDFWHRAELVEAKPGSYPADIPEHYNVYVKLKSKENGNIYKTEIDSRVINSWLSRFEEILKEELESDSDITGKYTGSDRNPTIVKILSNLVPIWVNTRSLDVIEN